MTGSSVSFLAHEDDEFHRNSAFISSEPGEIVSPAEMFKILSKIIKPEDILGISNLKRSYHWCILVRDHDILGTLLKNENFVSQEGKKLKMKPMDSKEIVGKICWMPHQTPNQEVVKFLENYGKVTGLHRTHMEIDGQKLYDGNRSFKIELKDGIKKSDLPHFSKIENSQVLVIVFGRAPLCGICKDLGHIAKNCPKKKKKPMQENHEEEMDLEIVNSQTFAAAAAKPTPTTTQSGTSQEKTPAATKTGSTRKTPTARKPPAPRKKRAPPKKKGGKQENPIVSVPVIQQKENEIIPEKPEVATPGLDKINAKRTISDDEEEKAAARARCKKQMQEMMDAANAEFGNAEAEEAPVPLEPIGKEFIHGIRTRYRNQTESALKELEKSQAPTNEEVDDETIIAIAKKLCNIGDSDDEEDVEYADYSGSDDSDGSNEEWT